MNVDGKTGKKEHSISDNECDAMRLLADDGWSFGEIRMCFHLSTSESVRHHVGGMCACRNRIDPVEL